jgi:hypothetical protein
MNQRTPELLCDCCEKRDATIVIERPKTDGEGWWTLALCEECAPALKRELDETWDAPPVSDEEMQEAIQKMLGARSATEVQDRLKVLRRQYGIG